MKRRSPETIAREVLGVGPRFDFRAFGNGAYRLGLGRNSFIVSDHAAAHIADVIAAAIRADRKQRKEEKRT